MPPKLCHGARHHESGNMMRTRAFHHPLLRCLIAGAVVIPVPAAVAAPFTAVGQTAAKAAAVTPAEPGRPEAAKPAMSVSIAGKGVTLRAPTTRIYQSVDRSGRIIFADHPVAGAQSLRVRSFASASDSHALATAKREQAYWHAQAQGFEQRLREREEAEARACREAQEAAARAPVVVLVPHHLRPPAGTIGGLPVPPGHWRHGPASSSNALRAPMAISPAPAGVAVSRRWNRGF